MDRDVTPNIIVPGDELANALPIVIGKEYIIVYYTHADASKNRTKLIFND